jgi:hypothetical protein
MGLQFFKPNKSVKGALAHFTFNSKDGALYLQLVRQTGYDESRHIGSFKDGAKLNVKFNAPEIGGFLRTLREAKPCKFVHRTADGKITNITFGTYNAKDSDVLAGFGLSIVQGDTKFSIPFTLDETYLLEEYLKYVLSHFFDAIYSEDKQRAAEYNKKNEAKSSPKKEPKKEEPADDFGQEDDSPQEEEDEADLF